MNKTISIVALVLMVLPMVRPLDARPRRGRGSVTGASRANFSRSGNTTSWQGNRGNASGSRTVDRSDSGATASREAETQSGGSREVSREVDRDDQTVERESTLTTAGGETVERERTTEAEGGYASIEGDASTSTGREAEFDGVADRNRYGQPAVAGTVDTKYSGNYAVAARGNPYGGYTSAAVGPYGGKVTRTLPSGYRVTTYHGRNYYAYGGAYYRPYTHGGVHYYYPVPVPYYAYYYQPPAGAIMVMVGAAMYLAAADGSYSKKTTDDQGQVAYQSVPAPEGAALETLPTARAFVTVSGTTYYVYSNAFYRSVVQGGKEQFVVVTPPAGVVFVSALPADFDVVQLNTMYFVAEGHYYLPYLTADGQELYVLVDTPPQPPPATAQTAAASAASEPSIREVAETLTVPTGTLILVRPQADVSSASAKVGDRFQAFVDQDVGANGRLILAKGAKAYGVVTAVDDGSKMKGQASIAVTLTDVQVGSEVVAIETEPLQAQGAASSGGKKLAGGAILGATIGAIADGGSGAAIGAGVGAGVGGAAAAAGDVDPAVVAAQSVQSFTVAVPFQVEVMTNVAVR